MFLSALYLSAGGLGATPAFQDSGLGGPEMNTLFFKYALEIERTRSITKAAENLFMAQPNLSKVIKELEYEIGFTIFERNSKGVIPTKKGCEFLVYARKILEEMEHISRIARKKQKEPQDFSISIPRTSYIAEGFTRFARDLDLNKKITITVQETGPVQTVTNVAEKKFNMGIIRYQTVYENYYLNFLGGKNLIHEPLWEFEYLVLMSKNHDLAQQEEISADSLEPYIEIIYGDTIIPQLQRAEPGHPAPEYSAKKRIYLYERGNQFDLLAGLPQTYMWESPIPGRLLANHALVHRPCRFPKNRYKDVLVYRSGYSFTGLDRQFIDAVLQSRDEVSPRQYG